ncbi:hypothetical protein [Tuwongella immobilis]|uniref:Signal peptide protein: Hypothetical conserved protein n=1 Tax=Tuwongella immobilis TaxID=692036 RepID=A0A6C2YSD5_9BACT|nr:hypothetical protein [Tuwongella immobilis]VIP03885.1 signal peptide protein : Hypothetical conserved protein OS=uncultured planctomycete GN=HGMM_F01A04C09 PE=4 SV=1 [Tuwongella immobilis]VTS05137.1 signal peptide protein : Hypothetical conserved protein OS=uncultured planctomycete GN=HGMM_F01A04C09 PE=4 SV=1 [Tuwongella immobilis]
MLHQWIRRIAPVTLSLGLLTSVLPGTVLAADAPAAPRLSFGQLRTMPEADAKKQAEAWLKSVNKYDEKAFTATWSNPDRTVFEKVVATLQAGSPEAVKLLSESRKAGEVAPREVPTILKDTKQPAFFRSNLALAYARHLSSAKVYEEALEILQTVTPEQVVDPGTYFFHRAVAEYSTIQKEPAKRSIDRLLDDVQDAPDRYKMVATLMFFDMESWKKDEKDPSNIVRLMDNSERRLDLARGGQKTQEIQKKIIINLDETIKKIEEELKKQQQQQAGGGGGAMPTAPMQDSQIATNGGPGNVTEQKLKKLSENWGKMPEQERARAMVEITRDLHPRYREVIENHFRSLSKVQPAPR